MRIRRYTVIPFLVLIVLVFVASQFVDRPSAVQASAASANAQGR